jgi:RNA polymerase-interacting CarD/CdnL/TRCF family regulator
MSSLTVRDTEDLDETPLDLRVGALVVYGGHGLGRVSGERHGGGDTDSEVSIVVEFEGGLSVTLPLERAAACLRPVADADKLARIADALRNDGTPREASWQARTRVTRTKIAAGEPVGLAEVVRDAVVRQRRSPSGALSMYERELYLKARRLLAAELGAATATDEAQAEAWIDGQLGTSDLD